MSETKIKPCTCKSDDQDKRYGSGNRVWNKTTPKHGGWRCTVCGRERG